jgi:AbrB family looped-hinge helix DNA binding protein
MSETVLKTIKVSEKGQIAIPREIRISLGIKKGDSLILAAKNKKLLIQKATNIEKEIEADLLKFSEKTAKKLWDNKEDEIWDKV